ncbi:LysR family transcriptional regulator [Thalassomonas sp. RHCl1]|uniref:LysR family transcriptional regulator n=1 Tax=Thalassomonas sp. RHCl1 TaxID=2995320 RepID=UPI00248B7B42|nr:LysR family transcriptional regulator [Thalassomonas sp. RHCl1]
MKNTNNPDLNQLNIFRLMMEIRHVGKVANKIGVSQSALSHMLKKLRAQFDDPLFHKTSTGMEPTVRAQELYNTIIAPLQSLNSALLASHEFNPLTSNRTFILGTSDYLEKLLLVPLTHHLHRLAPGIKLRCVSYQDTDLAKALQNIDFVFGRYGTPPQNLYQKKLWQDSFITLVSREHPNIPGDELTLEQFIHEQHILISPHGSGRSIVDKALAALGHRREIILASHLFTTPTALVESSQMITTMPKRLALCCANHKKVKFLPPPLTLAPFEVSMLWGPLKHHDPGHQWFRRQIAELAAELE